MNPNHPNLKKLSTVAASSAETYAVADPLGLAAFTYRDLADAIAREEIRLLAELTSAVKLEIAAAFPSAKTVVVDEIADIVQTYLASPQAQLRECARQLLDVIEQDQLCEKRRLATVLTILCGKMHDQYEAYENKKSEQQKVRLSGYMSEVATIPATMDLALIANMLAGSDELARAQSNMFELHLSMLRWQVMFQQSVGHPIDKAFPRS